MAFILAKTVETKTFALSEGFLYALIGFCLVLVVLAVLMGFIYLLSYIVRKVEGKGKKQSAPATASAPELAPGSSGSVKLNNVDDRTAAMVMAIVADELKTPLNELKFISIKEINEEEK
ncbi:MAG: OadG family protein [Clostridia bacterium]|nr:OadG family protein [Clostridia bacterium]MBR5987214.1 OadG family protein [Clostridia bacterium]